MRRIKIKSLNRIKLNNSKFKKISSRSGANVKRLGKKIGNIEKKNGFSSLKYNQGKINNYVDISNVKSFDNNNNNNQIIYVAKLPLQKQQQQKRQYTNMRQNNKKIKDLNKLSNINNTLDIIKSNNLYTNSNISSKLNLISMKVTTGIFKQMNTKNSFSNKTLNKLYNFSTSDLKKVNPIKVLFAKLKRKAMIRAKKMGIQGHDLKIYGLLILPVYLAIDVLCIALFIVIFKVAVDPTPIWEYFGWELTGKGTSRILGCAYLCTKFLEPIRFIISLYVNVSVTKWAVKNPKVSKFLNGFITKVKASKVVKGAQKKVKDVKDKNKDSLEKLAKFKKESVPKFEETVQAAKDQVKKGTDKIKDVKDDMTKDKEHKTPKI